MISPKSLLFLMISIALNTQVSNATYSIAAVDRKMQAVGAAGISCTGNSMICANGGFKVRDVFKLVRGKGVLISQNQTLQPAPKQYLTDLLANGVHPKDIMTYATYPLWDLSSARQYSAINMAGHQDNATCGLGNSTGEMYADSKAERSGESIGKGERFHFSVQGNTITGLSVLENEALGFKTPAATCDELPEKMLAALEAGALNGGGDVRSRRSATYKRLFPPDGLPGDESFLAVDFPDGESIFFEGKFLFQLRDQLVAWRSKTSETGELINKCGSHTGAPLLQTFADSIVPYRNYCKPYALFGLPSEKVVQKGSFTDISYSYQKRPIEQTTGLLTNMKYELNLIFPDGNVDSLQRTNLLRDNNRVYIRSSFPSGDYKAIMKSSKNGILVDVETILLKVP